MKKRSIFFGVLGIICLIIPYIFNKYSLYRPFILLLGIIFFTMSFHFSKFKNIFLNIFIPIILLSITYGIDMLLYYKFDRLPIYVVEVKSSDNVRSYNSLFYSILKCGNKTYIDNSKKLTYMCNINDLEEIDINTFLLNPYDSYEVYNNKFVRIKGKISKISGIDELELASYETTKDNINGYVNFAKEKAVKIKSDLKKYDFRIYDYITVIGIVDTIIESDGKVTINLSNITIIKTDIYDDYTFDINKNNKEELIPLFDEYYLYGFDKINIIFKENNVYELKYCLSDGRITWEELIQNSPYQVLKNEENNEIAKIYILDTFNLIECKNNKRIIANKDFKINEAICLS